VRAIATIVAYGSINVGRVRLEVICTTLRFRAKISPEKIFHFFHFFHPVGIVQKRSSIQDGGWKIDPTNRMIQYKKGPLTEPCGLAATVEHVRWGAIRLGRWRRGGAACGALEQIPVVWYDVHVHRRSVRH
jgi:hypothetical protein